MSVEAKRPCKNSKENVNVIVDDRVHVVSIDTSSKQSVEAAAASLLNVTLYGLVNNAGIGNGLLLKDVMKVIYWGVRYVTDAFFPLLEKDGGRTVNVRSGAGPMLIAGANENSAASTYRGSVLGETVEDCIGAKTR